MPIAPNHLDGVASHELDTARFYIEQYGFSLERALSGVFIHAACAGTVVPQFKIGDREAGLIVPIDLHFKFAQGIQPSRRQVPSLRRS